MTRCPFCGRHTGIPAKRLRSGMTPIDENAFVYYISCYSCGAEGPKERTEEEAITKWNEREGVAV